MNLRFSHAWQYLLVFLAASAAALPNAARGNPIAPRHNVYIAAEKLQVVVGADASIRGVFRFQSVEKDEFVQTIGIEIEIPVWIPAVPKQGNDTVRRFLAAYAMSRPHYLDKINRDAWDEAIGLDLRVGKKVIKPRSFTIYKASELGPVWRRDGWHCVVASVMVPSKLLAKRLFRGLPEVVIAYLQPLRRTTDGQAEFFYVPTFENMPPGATTTDIRRYSLELIRSDSRLPRVPALLPLKHGEPIVFQTPGG